MGKGINVFLVTEHSENISYVSICSCEVSTRNNKTIFGIFLKVH